MFFAYQKHAYLFQTNAEHAAKIGVLFNLKQNAPPKPSRRLAPR
jgi:hypothetical protein